LKCAGVGGKFKFMAIREFPNALLERHELGTEFIEVPLPLLWSERKAVAGEG